MDDLLKEFYRVWTRCESTRGCYSCCPPHDVRCPKAHRPDAVCFCGRDELDALGAEIRKRGGDTT